MESQCQEKARSGSTSPRSRGPGWRCRPEHIRHHIEMSSVPRSSSTLPPASVTTRSPCASIPHVRSSVSGESASSNRASPASKSCHAVDGLHSFPPDTVVEVKALACELPRELGLPLSRLSISEIKREILSRGLVASIGDTTLWRWLSQDAIRPWYHRSWIFPRDPRFAEKAGPILDLYQGLWRGRPLGPRDFVICADEKTSIQARRRRHKTLPPARPNNP